MRLEVLLPQQHCEAIGRLHQARLLRDEVLQSRACAVDVAAVHLGPCQIELDDRMRLADVLARELQVLLGCGRVSVVKLDDAKSQQRQ